MLQHRQIPSRVGREETTPKGRRRSRQRGDTRSVGGWGAAKEPTTTEKFRFLLISAGIFFQVQYDVDATSVSILA